jgi:hypothetical protein
VLRRKSSGVNNLTLKNVGNANVLRPWVSASSEAARNLGWPFDTVQAAIYDSPHEWITSG